MRGAGVPAGRVADIEGAFATAAELGLDPVVQMPDGFTPQVNHPVRYSRSTIRSFAPPPGLGEHNDVVRQWLSGHGSLE
jgi:formyl-CoA transferase